MSIRSTASLHRRDVIKASSLSLAMLATGVHSSSTFGADESEDAKNQWWTWRGPTGNNHAAEGSFSANTYASDRIVWATPVPGRGHSSPIVDGKNIYLTTADKSAGTQSVLAYSRRNGKLVWSQLAHRGGLPAENHAKNTEASPSVAFDGKRIIAAFYNSSAIWLSAFSLAGKPMWQQSAGYYEPKTYKYGYAASPTLYQDTVIVAADFDGQSFLAAHDRVTGKPVWKTPRKNSTSFSSPIITNIGGSDQLLLSGGEAIISYDPSNGRERWAAKALTMATCGTIVWDGDLVFGSGGYPKSETACARSDGSGEVVWTNGQKCYEQSMLAVNGYVYAVTDAGVAHCWRASDGEMMWRERLGGQYSSSPVLAGDVIHVFNEQGQGFAFKASPDRYESVGGGKLGDDCFATPSIVGDTMYMRLARNQSGKRQEYLVAMK
jgi:outer membrane protein assembly factor BamB